MAIFGVLLMIVFILPMGRFAGGRGGDPIRGHMGTLTVYQSDIQRYRNEWEYLGRYAFVYQQIATEPGMPPQRTWAPIGYTLGPEAVHEIQQNPNMYPLLVEEAREMGVGVSKDELETLLTSQVRTPDEEGKKLIDPAESKDPNRVEYLRESLADFLLVKGAFGRATSVIKPSAPLTEYELATHLQQISLDMVQFSAEPYLSKVPAPTQAEMEKQFKQYANTNPLTVDLRADPFDFGYRYPDRIKLQYIGVPHSAVVDAALKKLNKNDQTRYDWDVAAYRYYEAHKSDYASTQPAGASGDKAPRPFKDVEDEARQAVLHENADKLMLSIRQRIVSTMAADYLAWKNATGAAPKNPTTEPTSSLGVRYDSDEYLTKLALLIQRDYGVLPTIVSNGNWQTAATLDSLHGISSASIDDPDVRPTPFPAYAIGKYVDFLPASQQDSAYALSLYQPSEPLKNDDGDVYLFRIDAGQAAHAPASLSEVAEKVKSDLRNKAAYHMAAAEAEKFLAKARAAKSISAAAKAANQQLIIAGPIRYQQTDSVPGYATLSPVGLRQFTTDAFNLLTLASSSEPHPIGVIPIQIQGRALVAQLSNIEPLWTDEDSLAELRSEIGQSVHSELASALATKWFNYDDLLARTGYQEVNASGAPGPSPRQQVPMQPPL